MHALAESWRHRVTVKESTCFVNLHFDCDHADVCVQSDLPVAGKITFTMKTEKAFAVRIPDWVDHATVTVQVDGTERVSEIKNGYLRVGTPRAGAHGVVSFHVPCKTETETVDGIVYTTTWVGNQLIAIAPRGTVSPLPF